MSVFQRLVLRALAALLFNTARHGGSRDTSPVAHDIEKELRRLESD
jgi:hypothetical protein